MWLAVTTKPRDGRRLSTRRRPVPRRGVAVELHETIAQYEARDAGQWLRYGLGSWLDIGPVESGAAGYGWLWRLKCRLSSRNRKDKVLLEESKHPGKRKFNRTWPA